MSPEDIVVLPELKAYIDPLTPDEYESLERSILDEGCRDALVLWGNILVDGHNRFGICQKHGLPFKTIQNERFQNMEDIHLWMIDQHLGRRSVSDFQRGVLALRKRDILAARIRQFREGMGEVSLGLTDSVSAIQPLIVGDNARALRLAARLREEGCWATAIRPPTVPVGSARLRLTLTAAHESADIARLLEVLHDGGE